MPFQTVKIIWGSSVQFVRYLRKSFWGLLISPTIWDTERQKFLDHHRPRSPASAQNFVVLSLTVDPRQPIKKSKTFRFFEGWSSGKMG